MYIDKNKDVYVILHGKTNLLQKSIDVLVSNGVNKDRIIIATTDKIGVVDDYIAMLWPPHNPMHIKIQQISKITESKPDNISGLWGSISKNDLFTINL